MIPGKKYNVEDFAEIAWRRRWVIAVPLVVISLATFLWTLRLPNRYRSEAQIVVVQPRIPDSYVKPVFTASLNERLQSLQQRILSRTQLERVIQELNLYPTERRTMLMESVVELMGRDIDIGVTRPKGVRRPEPNAFTVSFESESPRTAAAVAERLAALFVNSHLEQRELQANSTVQFLQTQLDEAKKRLFEQDKKLEIYTRTHAGQLPSDVSANTNMLQSTQSQLQQVADSMNRDRDRRFVLERTIAEEESTVIALRAPNADSLEPAAPAAQQLAAARASLSNMELRLKPDHPDVIRAKRLIRDLERKAEAEALQQPLSPASRLLTPQEAARSAKLTQMRAELATITRRLEDHEAQAKRLQNTLVVYQGRIAVAPLRESELTQLKRDHEVLEANYNALLKKAEDSKFAASVDERQVGEQFKILDAARIPERPVSPNRLRFSMIGLLAGLGIGLALAAFLEYRDTSLRTEDDVFVALSLPVVALVPTMSTAAERRRARRWRLLAATSAAATIIVAVAAVLWKLQLFESWIR